MVLVIIPMQQPAIASTIVDNIAAATLLEAGRSRLSAYLAGPYHCIVLGMILLDADQ